MKYVVFYDAADDVARKAPAHFPAHLERAQAFHARGTLLMIGTFADVGRDGAMGIFTTREAAQAFVDGDPFVINGVVKAWRILEWKEIFDVTPTP
ncbi:MAG TPA: YciI family protein [Vicinamibacterales bacterium]|nr:YciI family protein [Vicinamibacterales bacterium]